MDYIIHKNVPDSDCNIRGLKYSVMAIDPNLPIPTKVRESMDEPTNIVSKCVFEAEYNIEEYHTTAIIECFLWVLQDAAKRNCEINIRCSFPN